MAGWGTGLERGVGRTAVSAGAARHPQRLSHGARRMSRFIDATGERFWVVERERAAVTVTFGAVGENGRARTLAFDDPEGGSSWN